MDELENIRKRAKQLVRDHRAGLITLPERIRQGAPKYAGMTDREILAARFTLRDAHQLMAVELGFTSWQALVSASAVPQVQPPPSTASWSAAPAEQDLLAVRFEVDDVKALYLEVRDRGARLHQRLRREPWGQRTFIVTDPDGNLLSFGSHMPTPASTKGSR